MRSLLVAIFLSVLLGCKDDKPSPAALVLPTVETKAISAITGNSAMSGGNVTSTGGGQIWGRGVVLADVPNPVLIEIGQPIPPNYYNIVPADIPSGGAGAGSFDLALDGLSPGTTYYVRAYATNNVGISYGQEVITTLP